MKAVEELQLLGLTFTAEQIAREKQAVQTHIRQEQAKKAKRRARRKVAKQPPSPFHEDQDDRFFYIAGYTSGGAPYGVTWEKMGLSPWELPEEE